MEELTIGEVARQAGIRPSALRYYESIGLLPAPQAPQRPPALRLKHGAAVDSAATCPTGRLYHRRNTDSISWLRAGDAAGGALAGPGRAKAV